MEKDNIIIKNAIVHILDSTVGIPVLSDTPLDCGSDLCDFFKAHIAKISESDEQKCCEFEEDSPVYEYFRQFSSEFFVDFSKVLAEGLYSIMNANIAIPPADLAVVSFRCDGKDYMALLKLNYKSGYTHLTGSSDQGNSNDIIMQKALLPSETQRLSEAVIVDMEDYSIRLLEKKYEINGKKDNYLSTLYLHCHGPLSQKSRLDIVTKAVEQVNKKYYPEDDVDRKLEVKTVIYSELEEQGSLNVEAVKQKVFADNPEMQQEFQEKVEKYNIQNEEIRPQNQQTIKKFQKQVLTTDTGIEISIPMELLKDTDNIQFITNADGTISLHIENIGKLVAK